MSIANIVTRGFGSFGSIADVTTAGYLPQYPVVNFPRATITSSGVVTTGIMNQEYNLESITITSQGILSADAPVGMRPVRGRPLRSQAFNTRKR